MIFYTDWFVPKHAAGCARGPFIFIRPEYKDDAGLLAHEKYHVRQWRRNPLHGLFYWFSKRYRLKSEVNAYRIQSRHYADDRLPLFAKYIAANYGLSVNERTALLYLKRGMKL